MTMTTSTWTSDVSLSQKVQNNLSHASLKHIILDFGEHKKKCSKKRGETESIICKIMKMLSINMMNCFLRQTIFLYYNFLVHTKNTW